MLTSRELPAAEWSRLEGTALGPIWSSAAPQTLRATVVEDRGAIVGCAGIVLLPHLEGFWVADEHRSRGVVLRRLLASTARLMGHSSVIAGPVRGEVASMLRRTGAMPLGVETFLCDPADWPAVKGTHLWGL
jgi:hypothetical protein